MLITEDSISMSNFYEDKVSLLHFTIRENIRKLRMQKNKTQQEIALSLGHASISFYSRAELGIENKKFNLEHLCILSEIFEIDICRFFDGFLSHCNQTNKE